MYLINFLRIEENFQIVSQMEAFRCAVKEINEISPDIMLITGDLQKTA